MIEPQCDQLNNLTRAVAVEVMDIHHAAELVRAAANLTRRQAVVASVGDEPFGQVFAAKQQNDLILAALNAHYRRFFSGEGFASCRVLFERGFYGHDPERLRRVKETGVNAKIVRAHRLDSHCRDAAAPHSAGRISDGARGGPSGLITPAVPTGLLWTHRVAKARQALARFPLSTVPDNNCVRAERDVACRWRKPRDCSGKETRTEPRPLAADRLGPRLARRDLRAERGQTGGARPLADARQGVAASSTGQILSFYWDKLARAVSGAFGPELEAIIGWIDQATQALSKLTQSEAFDKFMVGFDKVIDRVGGAIVQLIDYMQPLFDALAPLTDLMGDALVWAVKMLGGALEMLIDAGAGAVCREGAIEQRSGFKPAVRVRVLSNRAAGRKTG